MEGVIAPRNPLLDCHANIFMSRLLFAISALYVALAIGYMLLIPIGEAPDEPAHFLYVDTFAQTQDPPLRPQLVAGGWLLNVTQNYEWHQPPLYYWLASLLLSFNRSIDLVPQFQSFPAVIATEYRVFAPIPERFTEIHLVRILSIVAGLGTILTTYFLTRRVFPEERGAAELAAGFVAFIPQFTFLHAYVTNDVLAILLSTLTMLALTNVALSAPESQPKAWTIAGIVLSVALTVKLTTWFLIGVATLLAGMMIITRRVSLRRGIFHFTGFVCLSMMGLLITWLIWPDLPHRLFDFQAGGIKLQQLRLEYWIELIPMTHSSFWGRFGWMNLPIPFAFQLFLDLVAIVGLIAFATAAYQQWRHWSVEQRISIIVMVAAIFLNFASFLLFNLTTRQPQGRFFFPTISIIALFVAAGWLQLAKNHQTLVTLVILVSILGINIFSLFGIILPAYRY